MKIVHCYFDSLGGAPHQGELIRFWYLSWSRRGWDPRMLSPRSFYRSPYRKQFKAEIARRGISKAAPSYRWLALYEAKGSLLVDYDLINFGLRPQDYRHRPAADELLISPGFYHIGKDALESYLLDFLSHRGDLPHQVVDSGDFSVDYGFEGWRKAPLVHFSTQACLGNLKHEMVEICGRTVG